MAYLDIQEKAFAYMRDEGIEKSKENLGDDYKDEITLDDSLLDDKLDEVSFDSSTGKLNCSFILTGTSKKGNVDLGYLSLDLELDLDTVTDLVSYYMKKIGKLKTILEATK